MPVAGLELAAERKHGDYSDELEKTILMDTEIEIESGLPSDLVAQSCVDDAGE